MSCDMCVCVGPSIPDTTTGGNLPTATDASHAESYPPCGKPDASDEGKTEPRLPEVAETLSMYRVRESRSGAVSRFCDFRSVS